MAATFEISQRYAAEVDDDLPQSGRGQGHFWAPSIRNFWTGEARHFDDFSLLDNPRLVYYIR